MRVKVKIGTMMALSLILIMILGACTTTETSPSEPVIVPSPTATSQQPEVTPTQELPEVTPTQEQPAAPEDPIPVENFGLTFAYIGPDGNLWITDASGGPPRQVTNDAIPVDAGNGVVSYYFPKISSDGRYIAARRDAGEPTPEGLRYLFSLRVFDTETGEARTVYEDDNSPPAEAAWKPGTHLLAYGVAPDPNYFTGGGPDSTLATGIFAIDLDSGSSNLLVGSENGYALIAPVWSPDGQILSFDELVYMEGKGPFAYYNFEASEYVSWNEPLGNYDWSPDGNQLVYDRLTYSAQGTERIFNRPRLEGAEIQVSPDQDQGYAFYPVYSPDGMQVAYLVNPGGPESVQNTLVVQNLESGEYQEFGSYESIWSLEWSSDGTILIFSAGPYDASLVYGLDLKSGTEMILAQGSQPTLARP